MRVLVTGAAGFVGKQLCRELIGRGIETRAVVRSLPNDAESIGADFRVGDVTEANAMASAVEGIDAVVHLAARVHVMRDTAADPLAQFRSANVDGTRILAHASRAAGVKHLVFASSVKAVGEASQEVWNNATVPQPVDAYGISKHEAENVLLSHQPARNPSITIVRFPLIYGPGMKGNMLRLFRMVDRGWPVPIGTRPNARSMLFVGNATAALMRAVERAVDQPSLPRPPGPFFVADGPAMSTSALVESVAAALGRHSRTLPLPRSILRVLGRVSHPLVGDRLTAVFDRLLASLAVDEREFEREYDFHPPYTRREGIEITAEWFRRSW